MIMINTMKEKKREGNIIMKKEQHWVGKISGGGEDGKVVNGDRGEIGKKETEE